MSRLVRVTAPVALLTSLVGTTTAAHAITPTYPSVTITSPAQNADWKGIQAVYATLATDPAGTDYPATSTLYVDGVASDHGSAGCQNVPSVKSCAEHYLWDAAGQTGNHTAHITMITHNGVTFTTADLTIHAVSPPPSVTIDTPSEGDNVSGSDVIVGATATMDATQGGDFPHSTSLVVDGTVVDTQSCDLTQRSCYPQYDWDATTVATGSHTLTVTMTTTHGIVGTSAATHVTVVDLPVPVVTITSPAANAVVSGTVNITATGSVASTYGDAPMLMGLFVDGNLVGQTQDCPATGSCTLTFPWDSTGKYGAHEIVVALLTQQYVEGDSAPRILTVRVPQPPSVVINSPAVHATILGSTTVSATATLDPDAHDRAVDLQLMVDGAPSGTPVPCSGDATTTCTVSLPWTPTGLLGNHNIAVRLDTLKTTVTSALRQVSVTQYSQPGQTKLTFGRAGSASAFYAFGQVTDGSQLPLAGVPVTLTIKPVVGKVRTVVGTTLADGRYSILIGKRPATDETLTVTLSADYGSISTTLTLRAEPLLKCGIPTSVKHGARTTVKCTLAGVPNGFKATLITVSRKGVHAVAHGVTKSGRITFTFSLPTKGHLTLEATVAGNHLFRDGATSAAVKVHVV